MQKQKTSVTTLALLLFLAIFGISNIPNNYSQLGNTSIGWFVLLGLVFIPLALIMAELGSINTESRSGMTGWIEQGLGKKWAFLGAWSYFIANIFYLPMLASRVPIQLSWVFTSKIDSLQQVVDTSGQIPGVINATNNQTAFLVMAFVTVILTLILGLFFEKVFEKIGKIIGWLSLGVTALFIVLALLSVPMLGTEVHNPITFSNSLPKLDGQALTTFAWILFAICGVETVGSYIGVVDNPKKTIPKGIVLAAILVIFSYVIGFVSMAFILTPDQVPVDHMENMTQIMYAQIGQLWGFGPMYLRIIMFIYVLITVSALVLWLVSTVTVLFDELPEGLLSEKVASKRINGVPVAGIFITGIMTVLFLIISNSAVSGNIYTTLYNMATIAVLIPYLLILISYIKYRVTKHTAPYQMCKSNGLAIALSGFVLVITVLAIIFSSWDLTITDMGERVDWFITSAGGTFFFLMIGYGIYLQTEKKNLSFIILIALFVIAGITFGFVFYFVALILAVAWFITNKQTK